MKKALTITLALILTGCTTVSHKYSPVSGSKSDGRVTMAYFYQENPFIQNEVDEASAHREALRRCKNWGYQRVEGFVAVTQMSHFVPGTNVPVMKVTREFQCIDE